MKLLYYIFKKTLLSNSQYQLLLNKEMEFLKKSLIVLFLLLIEKIENFEKTLNETLDYFKDNK